MRKKKKIRKKRIQNKLRAALQQKKEVEFQKLNKKKKLTPKKDKEEEEKAKQAKQDKVDKEKKDDKK